MYAVRKEAGAHTEAVLPELARRAIAGDARAVDRLLGELGPEIARTARLVVGSGSGSDAAEDAAQEAMIDVMRGIRRLREPAAIRAWVLRVTAVRAVKVARRERALQLLSSPRPVPELADGPTEESQADLKAAFDGLPPRMRAIAVLRLCAGLSEGETAAAVGCARGTIKSQLHDARHRLAETLRGQGVRPLT